MGESAVAYRYAEALYQAAREQGVQAEVLEAMAAFKRSMDGDPQAWAGVFDPRLQVEDKERLLVDRHLEGSHPLLVNLVRLLLRRHREAVLRDIFRVYLEVHEQGEGILRVRVETARELEPPEQEELRRRLESATGRTVALEALADPSLLGGVRLESGSRVADGSLRSRLERMRRRMKAARVG